MPPRYPNFTIEEAFEAAGPPPGGEPYGWKHFHEGEPPVSFFTNPPKDAKAIFSTLRGTKVFRTVDNPVWERDGYYWWAAQIQLTCDEIRRNFFSECKYLQAPRDYWDLYAYFDAYEIYHRGAQNLWNVIHHLIFENTVVLPDLLKDAMPMIESWALEVLASERARNKLRAWNTEIHQDILAVFDEGELEDISGMEPFYMDHIRSTFCKYRYDLLTGQSIIPSQPLLGGEKGPTPSKQLPDVPYQTAEDDKHNIKTGSKVIDGVVVVDGTSATAARMNAHKKAKKANRTRKIEQVRCAQLDSSTSKAATSTSPGDHHSQTGAGPGRPQTASAPPTESRYASGPTFGAPSTMGVSEDASNNTEGRVYPGNKHEVGKKLKGCIKPDDPAIISTENISSNLHDTSSTDEPAAKTWSAVPTTDVPSQDIQARADGPGQPMRPFCQPTPNHHATPFTQRRISVNYEQLRPVTLRGHGDTSIQGPPVYRPYNQHPISNLGQDNSGSAAFVNQIPQLPPHVPYPNQNMRRASQVSQTAYNQNNILPLTLGHGIKPPVAPPQQQGFSHGQGAVSTSNFQHPQQNRKYSGPPSGNRMGWRSNGNDPIHGPKVVFYKGNTHPGQNHNPSHGPKNTYNGNRTSHEKAYVSDSPHRSYKGTLTPNRRTSVSSNHSYNLGSGRSHRHSSVSSWYRDPARASAEPSGQSSAVISYSHDGKPFGQARPGSPIYLPIPTCRNASKKPSMHTKFDPCPCPSCDEKDRSIHIGQLRPDQFRHDAAVEDLKQFLSQFGPVESIIVIPTNYNAVIVRFYQIQSAQAAVKHLHMARLERFSAYPLAVNFRTGSQFFQPLPFRAYESPHKPMQITHSPVSPQDMSRAIHHTAMPTPILEEPSVSGTINARESLMGPTTPSKQTDNLHSAEVHGSPDKGCSSSSSKAPGSSADCANPRERGHENSSKRRGSERSHIFTPSRSSTSANPSPTERYQGHIVAHPTRGRAQEVEIDYGTMVQRPGRAKYMSLPEAWTNPAGSIPVVRDFAPQHTLPGHRNRDRASILSVPESALTKQNTKQTGYPAQESDTAIQTLPPVAYVPGPNISSHWYQHVNPGLMTASIDQTSIPIRHDQPGLKSRSASPPAKRKIEQPTEDTQELRSPKKKTIQTWKASEARQRKNTNQGSGYNNKSQNHDQKRLGPKFTKQHKGGHHNTIASRSPQPVISGNSDEKQLFSTYSFKPDLSPSVLPSFPQEEKGDTNSSRQQPGNANETHKPETVHGDGTSHENNSPSKPEPFPAYRDLMFGPSNSTQEHKGHDYNELDTTNEDMSSSGHALANIQASGNLTKNKLNPRAMDFVSSSANSSAPNSRRTTIRGNTTPAPEQQQAAAEASSVSGQITTQNQPSSNDVESKTKGPQKTTVAVPQQGDPKQGPEKNRKTTMTNEKKDGGDKSADLEKSNSSGGSKSTAKHLSTSIDEPKSSTTTTEPKAKGKQGGKYKSKSFSSKENSKDGSAAEKKQPAKAPIPIVPAVPKLSKPSGHRTGPAQGKGSSSSTPPSTTATTSATVPATAKSSNAENSSNNKQKQRARQDTTTSTAATTTTRKKSAASTSGAEEKKRPPQRRDHRSGTMPTLSSEDWPELSPETTRKGSSSTASTVPLRPSPISFSAAVAVLPTTAAAEQAQTPRPDRDTTAPPLNPPPITTTSRNITTTTSAWNKIAAPRSPSPSRSRGASSSSTGTLVLSPPTVASSSSAAPPPPPETSTSTSTSVEADATTTTAAAAGGDGGSSENKGHEKGNKKKKQKNNKKDRKKTDDASASGTWKQARGGGGGGGGGGKSTTGRERRPPPDGERKGG
ncbi:hypothetical protein F5X96DRAFT_685456 [Biscogniauxia mediterranea]|nr:hypothetical protein F5X96DRAFT_685456 [Biscogniauxia mediterranea]